MCLLENPPEEHPTAVQSRGTSQRAAVAVFKYLLVLFKVFPVYWRDVRMKLCCCPLQVDTVNSRFSQTILAQNYYNLWLMGSAADETCILTVLKHKTVR